MTKYLVTIKNDNVTLKGEFESQDAGCAYSDAQLYYAGELDTEPEEIEIIEVKEID